MKRLLSFVVACLLSATVATASPITLTFGGTIPVTGGGEYRDLMSVTFTEIGGQTFVTATALFDWTSIEGWKFDGLWLEGNDPYSKDGSPNTFATWEMLQAGWTMNYSFAQLNGRWFDARWFGPCPLCYVEGPEREEQEPPVCEVVDRQQFNATPVPEPGGMSLMLLGMTSLFLFRRFTR